MKTSMNQIVAGPQGIGLRLLEWRGGRAVEQKRKLRGRVPQLRIVGQDEGQRLFKYAWSVQARNGLWETIVYASLGVSAAGALLMAFL